MNNTNLPLVVEDYIDAFSNIHCSTSSFSLQAVDSANLHSTLQGSVNRTLKYLSKSLSRKKWSSLTNEARFPAKAFSPLL